MPIHKTSTLKLSQHSLDVFPHTDTEVHFQSVCEVTGATEPLRLEETSQIPNPTNPPYPLSLSATSTALGHPRDGAPPPRPAVPLPDCSVEKRFLLLSNRNLSWCNLRPFPLSYHWLPRALYTPTALRHTKTHFQLSLHFRR